MRHRAASSLLADGATPAVVQKQLRHGDPTITLGIYAPVVGSQQREAVERRATRIMPLAGNLVQAGVSPQVAKQVSGHQSDSMFQGYNILTTDDLSKALTRTEKYRKAEEAKKPQVVSLR